MTVSNLKKLLKNVEEKYGEKPFTPKDFFCLSLDIEAKTGKKVSVSTIKRLWGYVQYDNEPSKRTLNILSKFVGYDNYLHFTGETSQ